MKRKLSNNEQLIITKIESMNNVSVCNIQMDNILKKFDHQCGKINYSTLLSDMYRYQDMYNKLYNIKQNALSIIKDIDNILNSKNQKPKR